MNIANLRERLKFHIRLSWNEADAPDNPYKELTAVIRLIAVRHDHPWAAWATRTELDSRFQQIADAVTLYG